MIFECKSRGFSKKALVRFPCGSLSITRTFFPLAANPFERLKVRVVLPTPPFWLFTAIIEIIPPLQFSKGSDKNNLGFCYQLPADTSLSLITKSLLPRRRLFQFNLINWNKSNLYSKAKVTHPKFVAYSIEI